MTQSRLWRQFDYLLLVTTIALVGYGLIMIYSATLDPQLPLGFNSEVVRQALFAVAGLALFVLLVTFDYRLLAATSSYIYWAGVGSMALVLIIGGITHGSQRWITVAGFTLEPSEPAKIVLCIALARFLADHEEQMRRWRYVALSALLVLPFFVLTLLQPNLGTALVFVVIWVAMLAMAGLRLRQGLVVGTLAAVAVPLVWGNLMQGYMKERVLTFLSPQSDPLGAGYNVIQAVISVGSGGMTGQGLTSGTQSQLHFLRVRYSDFVFSVLGEELGFLGAMLLLGLLLLLLMRGVRAASLAETPFGRFLATGVIAIVVFQVFTNIGMNIGLLPVTGVPLPFISYGGSSLVTLLVGIGILESIVARRSPRD